MSKHLKVVVIGGGSSYTPELVEGFIKNYDQFPVDELYLVDIEIGKEKLDIVSRLAKRMLEKAKVPIQVLTTLDRTEALTNADFVCTQIRVGGLAARANDEKIPLSYGKIGQETTGAGGFAKALRTVPVILDICKDMEQLCPSAVLINFTNPAGIVTEAVYKYTNIQTIGLCNLPIGIKMQVADAMKVDVSQVDIEMVGINHLNWTRDIRINGVDRTAEVIEKISSTGGLMVKNIPEMDMGHDFVTNMGMLPCSYLTYYYLQDGMIKDQLESLKKDGTRAEVVMKTEKELFALYEDEKLDVKPQQLEDRGGAYYSDAAVNLMTSMYNDSKDLQVVNVRNNGMIPFLHNDASIEIKCVIGASGPQPVQLSEPVPDEIKGILQVVKNYETLTVEATVHQDYQKGLQALTTHPLVGSVTTARNILDEFIQVNDQYICLK